MSWRKTSHGTDSETGGRYVERMLTVVATCGQRSLDVLGYLTASMGLESGDLGGFRIMPGAVGTGLVLVGAKEARTIYELPGVPIRVEGIDPHHGAIDPALFGYMAQITNNAAALALVDTDPA